MQGWMKMAVKYSILKLEPDLDLSLSLKKEANFDVVSYNA